MRAFQGLFLQHVSYLLSENFQACAEAFDLPLGTFCEKIFKCLEIMLQFRNRFN